ncbi:MAG: multicopper oxidase family protein [Sporichthyaceae bacterium]
MIPSSDDAVGPTRRSFLALGGLAVAGAAGAAGAGRVGGAGGAALEQPTVLRSARGRLDVRLVADSGTWLGGQYTQAFGYNRSSPGPTLVVSPGDVLAIRLVNRLNQPTNLHTHGLRVSPSGRGDNPFVSVEPGESFDYRIAIPEDHPLGTHWYHPHRHGHVADQVAGGLLGALLVVPNARTWAPSAVDRVLVLSEADLEETSRPRPADDFDRHVGRRAGQIRVNGFLSPRILGEVGRPQRWRVINGCPSRTVVLRLPGHRVLQAGLDGNALRELRNSVAPIPPGGRADLIVEPREAGRFALSHAIATVDGDLLEGLPVIGTEPQRGEDLLTLASVGVGAGTGARRPAAPLLHEVSRRAPARAVGRRRRLVFGDGDNMFTIDGRLFDHHRVDQQVASGSVEEWTVANEGHMFHPFHLHGWQFTVLGFDGERPAEGAPPLGVPQDVVLLPPFTEVRLRVDFRGHDGRSVYHCHVLDHEDAGMMGVVQVG